MHRDLVASPVLLPPTGPAAGASPRLETRAGQQQRRHCHSHARPAFGESGPGATLEYCGIWHGSDLAQGAHLSGERWHQRLCEQVTARDEGPLDSESGSRRCSNIWRKGRAFLGAGICNRWPREVSEGERQLLWCCGHWLLSVLLHPNTSGHWWELWVAPRHAAAQTAPSVPACLPRPPPCHGEGTSSAG